MTIRLRILALLSLLSLTCIGFFVFFNRAQESEENFHRQDRVRTLTAGLERLVKASARPVIGYVRHFSQQADLGESLAKREAAWADQHLRESLESFQVDAVWVVLGDGRVVYAQSRHPGAVLAEPPVPATALLELFRANQACSFHAYSGSELYQIHGTPIVPAAGSAPGAAAPAWLLAARRWDQSLLDEFSEAGLGRVVLRAAASPQPGSGGQVVAAELPLLDHRGRVVAAVGFQPATFHSSESPHEEIEFTVFIINSVGAILLVGALLHFWILRPFALLRASLTARDPALLAPLLPQQNEFGQMARLVQSSMRDRERLERNLAERVQLARELHDGAIQGIFGAGMALSRVQSLMVRDLPAARTLLDEARAELNRIIGELRAHIDRADPRPLDSSFKEAVARLIQLTSGPDPVASALEIDETLVARHPPLFRSEALLFVREGVSNALRHGRPSRLTVSWQASSGGSTLRVDDNGVGFDPEAIKSAGRGLDNLRARAGSLGGRLAIESRPGEGTRVSLELPTEVASA